MITLEVTHRNEITSYNVGQGKYIELLIKLITNSHSDVTFTRWCWQMNKQQSLSQFFQTSPTPSRKNAGSPKTLDIIGNTNQSAKKQLRLTTRNPQWKPLAISCLVKQHLSMTILEVVPPLPQVSLAILFSSILAAVRSVNFFLLKKKINQKMAYEKKITDTTQMRNSKQGNLFVFLYLHNLKVCPRWHELWYRRTRIPCITNSSAEGKWLCYNKSTTITVWITLHWLFLCYRYSSMETKSITWELNSSSFKETTLKRTEYSWKNSKFLDRWHLIHNVNITSHTVWLLSAGGCHCQGLIQKKKFPRGGGDIE